LVDDAAPAHAAPAAARTPRRHNLPASVARFIGREQELAQLAELLNESRLLTLTGPGGTGKTQLALKVASQALPQFADGAHFVDLAPLSDARQVVKAILDSLGILETVGEDYLETVQRALSDQELLLLIDNFEHVIDAAPAMPALLTAAPRLKIIITSREALRVSGEQEYPVPPLSLPSKNASLASLIESEAGALFVQRLRMFQPDFEITAETAPAIVQICRRLDGLPLAIELAAARCKLLSPQTLLARLDKSLGTLTGGPRDVPLRQQTLRATMEWSYKLLEPGEQMLFARLAPFRGGRALEALEGVCADGLPIDLYDGLQSLIDKSLVQQRETARGEPRFFMLDTIQEYARERLEASGEADMIHRRHAQYFAELAERADPELRMSRQVYWSHILKLELGNLRAALTWSLNDGDITLGVRLAGALAIFWYWYGYHVEGLHWMGRLLERLDGPPTAYSARLLYGAGMLETFRDIRHSEQLLLRAIEAARNLNDKLLLAWTLTFAGYTGLRDKEKALATAGEALALFRELDYKPGMAQALNILGEISRFHSDDELAKRYYDECLAITQVTGETRRLYMMHQNLAFIAQHRGDHAYALAQFRESIRLCREVANRLDMASVLVPLAGSLGMVESPVRAVRLFGASQVAMERMGAFHQHADQPEMERNIAEVRARLSEAEFAAAWAEGRKIALEDAIADALDEAPAL
ncbi:MAG: AAA family ATPase, partial [Anaerolineae bacterium]|nr:AAA family ATPase [Anaerolineae bacterium]